MDKTNIKQWLDSPAGKDLKKILQDARDSADFLYRIRDLDEPTEIAIEVKAQRKAARILVEILSEIMTLSSPSKGRQEADKLHDL